jgi:hypothetical protein
MTGRYLKGSLSLRQDICRRRAIKEGPDPHLAEPSSLQSPRICLSQDDTLIWTLRGSQVDTAVAMLLPGRVEAGEEEEEEEEGKVRSEITPARISPLWSQWGNCFTRYAQSRSIQPSRKM